METIVDVYKIDLQLVVRLFDHSSYITSEQRVLRGHICQMDVTIRVMVDPLVNLWSL